MSTISSPPGRRKQRKGDLTAQAILDTAESLLATKPLDEIAVDELTTGAGVSRSAFYFHFASREAVLFALGERVAEDLDRAADVWFRRSDEQPPEAIRRAIRATVAVWRQHGPVLRAIVRAREVDPQLGEFWRAMARRFVESAAEQIERERAAGVAVAGPPPAKLLAGVLVGMNDQACYHHSLTRRRAAADEAMVDTLTEVWLRAVYG